MNGVHRALSVAELARKCDAIFVLAGVRERKAYGLELYREGLAPRVLLSVGRFDIRRLPQLELPVPLDLLSAVQTVPPPERHFFVEFDANGVRFEKTRVGRFGTLAEIRALAQWCEKNPEVESLVVISSEYHLRRVRMCCRALLPKRVQCAFVQTPNEAMPPMLELIREAFKVGVYRAMLWSHR